MRGQVFILDRIGGKVKAALPKLKMHRTPTAAACDFHVMLNAAS
jgi:hypothetical protein